MIFRVVTSLFVFYSKLAYGCLPTQQVEVTTTTTVAPMCSVCTPIYRDPPTCISMISTCVDAATVGVVYTRSGDVCSTTYTCPAGYTSQSTDPMAYTPVSTPGAATLTCDETGPSAGTWTLGGAEISETTCGV